MITDLKLQNFTAFKNAHLSFSPGINIIVGENATGKTQLLKIMYALGCGEEYFNDIPNNSKSKDYEPFAQKISRLFKPHKGLIKNLRNRDLTKQDSAKAEIILMNDQRVILDIYHNSNLRVQYNEKQPVFKKTPVFIPTKEVLSLVRGMNSETSDEATIRSIFDDTYIDLAKRLIIEGCDDDGAKIQSDPKLTNPIVSLVKLLNGRYRLEDGDFVFQEGYYEEKSASTSEAKHAQMYQDLSELKFIPVRNDRFSSGMTAEGFRKVGIIHRLLVNGELSPGESGPLLWDEPESNLNPIITKSLVSLLLEIARNGQQIIIATHDYVLLKWFDLLSERKHGDHINYHHLIQDDDGAVVSKSTDDFDIISKTSISESFSELYDADIERAIG